MRGTDVCDEEGGGGAEEGVEGSGGGVGGAIRFGFGLQGWTVAELELEGAQVS